MCRVCQQPQDGRKTVEGARSTFMSAMSDAGLKPTVVYHNLTPAELYEKVRALQQDVVDCDIGANVESSSRSGSCWIAHR